MKAIIYKQAKNVMQSGRGKDSLWILEYDTPVTRSPENLNGWTSASSTIGQVQMKFQSAEHAAQYASDNGLEYSVQPFSTRKIRPRNYTDNFKYTPPETE